MTTPSETPPVEVASLRSPLKRPVSTTMDSRTPLVESARRPSICFVAPKAYGVLAGRDDVPHIGGAEVQQVLIARGLAQRGFSVSFVVHDHGQPDGIEHEGIRVFKMCRSDAGVPGLRFLHPRWSSLWAAMRRAAADVYYQRSASCETGQCALWCKLVGRRFVYAVASDSDCDPALPYLYSRRERLLYRLGLRRAAQIVAQTRRQQEMLAQGFGLEALHIASCARDPLGPDATLSSENRDRYRVLWVGRITPKKRFDRVVELAKLCPEFKFDVVADIDGLDADGSRLLAEARGVPTLHLHGRVVPRDLGRFYDRAGLVLCTSDVEGFPNCFLEAWSRGVPTLSTFDPDGMITHAGLGLVADSPQTLREAALGLLCDDDVWQMCATRARELFVRQHTVATALEAYRCLLAGI